MTREVPDLSKEAQLFPGERCPCPCGCGVVSVLLRKPLANGELHVRGCKCRPHMGSRNRRSGMAAQRKFQKQAGIKQASWRGANGNEESWRDYWRFEVKSGGQVRPAVTAYLRQRQQADANRPVGDVRPFAAGMTYSGTSIVCVSAADWAAHVAPLLEEAG